jgi:perosamine synthetase
MTIRIPLSAPDITSAEIDAVTAVLRTNRLSLGPELEAFEQALAAYHSIPDAVAVSSGTAGLHLALLALGIGEGSEVIVPSFGFVAVANAVLQVRATPVFVDIDPVTLNLDPALVEEAITPRTRAILVVHTFGVPAETDRLQEIARRGRLRSDWGRVRFEQSGQLWRPGGARLLSQQADHDRRRRLCAGAQRGVGRSPA